MSGKDLTPGGFWGLLACIFHTPQGYDYQIILPAHGNIPVCSGSGFLHEDEHTMRDALVATLRAYMTTPSGRDLMLIVLPINHG
jgi:hypothetical protein